MSIKTANTVTGTKTPTGRASRGTVSIEAVRGRLRLRFRVQGQQRTLSLGLPSTKENCAIAEAKAKEIERDIVFNQFDQTLGKYLPKHLKPLQPSESKQKELTLAELWDKYCEYKKPNLAESTYINEYRNYYFKLIKEIPFNCVSALDIRTHILKTRSSYRAKRALSVIDACFQWGLKNKLVNDNPFGGMAQEIKVSKAKAKLPKSVQDLEQITDVDNNGKYRAFTKEERDIIITAFENNGQIRHWANLVKFLFWTGCRPEEAVALRWKHISDDFKYIYFREAYAKIKGTSKGILKSTKTGEERTFLAGEKMQSFLSSIKPLGAKPDDLIFTSKKGLQVDWDTFASIWRGNIEIGGTKPGVISELIKDNKIRFYLKPYATRHTYITLMLNQGVSPIDIAHQVGNSPEIIMKHYASATRDLILPEV